MLARMHARTYTNAHNAPELTNAFLFFFEKIPPPLSPAFFVRHGENHYSQANLNLQEKNYRPCKLSHFPGKWGKVIWFEINPFTVSILKPREKGKKSPNP